MKFKAKTERSDQKKEGEHMVRSIVEALAEYAKVQPDKLFLADGKVELTYLDAWKCVYGYAVHLRELGIRRGDHVVVRNSQNAQLVISQLAIQLVGAVFVPIEKNAADDRIAEIIGAVEAKLYLAAKQGEFSYKWETIKDVLSYKMDDAAEMRISESDDENGDSFRFPEPEETAEVLFTTGTTGKSKGIELTYESVIAVSENVIGSVEMKKDSVELIPVPLSHSHGLRRYYSNILNGGSVVIIDGVIFTKKFFGAIEKYHVTAIDLVPAALAALFKLSGDKLGEYADQLDYVQLGSAPIPNHDKEHLRELLPNTRLYNFYGTTESGCSCILDFNAMPDKKNCIGKPSCHAEFVFFDEQGNAIDATEETPGFLACRGTMNMKGYYHEPQLNQEIMRDDYICTKDLAYVGEDGLIYMLGRKDDVIITGGNKVAPDEIEEIAGGFEGIADCACIPVPHPLLGAEPKLFVEMENGAAFDEQGIYEYLQGKLEAYKVPKRIEQIDKIPRTYNGKLQRKKLIEAEKEKAETQGK